MAINWLYDIFFMYFIYGGVKSDWEKSFIGFSTRFPDDNFHVYTPKSQYDKRTGNSSCKEGI